MAHASPIGNPFMLMMNPEIVLAAMESSERLAQLNRRLCRPLDRLPTGTVQSDESTAADDDIGAPDVAS
jgi:hypothetical protein